MILEQDGLPEICMTTFGSAHMAELSVKSLSRCPAIAGAAFPVPGAAAVQISCDGHTTGLKDGDFAEAGMPSTA